MLSSAVLRAAPFIPLILYVAAALMFAIRFESDQLRLILSCAGSFAIYFYTGWIIAALLRTSPLARLLTATGLPVGLFLLLAVLDVVAPDSQGSGGFISLKINFKMLWAIPGMFLSRLFFR